MKDHPISKALRKYPEKTVFATFGKTAKTIYKEIKVDNINYPSGKIDKKMVSELLKMARPAPFGRGSETVYDESVRKAFEIGAERLQVTEGRGFKKIKKALARMSPLSKILIPKLYKMQIYTEGGFFKKHKDTLHASNHYATLVVKLPGCRFSGGTFVLEHDDETIDVDFVFETYAVFLTDVEHEVFPVTKGTRIISEKQCTHIKFLQSRKHSF